MENSTFSAWLSFSIFKFSSFRDKRESWKIRSNFQTSIKGKRRWSIHFFLDGWMLLEGKLGHCGVRRNASSCAILRGNFHLIPSSISFSLHSMFWPPFKGKMLIQKFKIEPYFSQLSTVLTQMFTISSFIGA